VQEPGFLESAPSTIVRNLSIAEAPAVPADPSLRKKTGPGESALIIRAMATQSGVVKTMISQA
jgi:hypothetical protein